ncbi:DUF3293 domain-containing protein [Aeromicrobium wangtongii]|uniref:DUF3293 domain-containing protein n=1 Tax=Aeromicrobium wangtongii TaxID=2969247 RepID=A0ABY5M618_9ACTN|nr:DUF3293 domain-containing protein [Aeromicrobium wangtongii]MCD9199993.1 DUF3293 domain-containing protein [Aeromicrobium wangtongii]UUP13610.1 DUF3293 domain-containing protein [Aeromicrobium wangtongii]
MSEDLLREYERTRYVVLDDLGIARADVGIGEVSDAIDAILADYGAASGVFITGWNPRSVLLDQDSNDDANARLEVDLDQAGSVILPHIGVGYESEWEPEHGFFALDLAEAEAVELATAYGQNAIVIVERGRPARLVLTPVMNP